MPPGSRICIIGGGSAGLITCKTLSVEGYDCTLLEKAPEVGGVWYHNQYPGVALQSPIELYEIADFPFEASVDKYATGAQLRRYFNRYARHFNIKRCLRLCREVVSCARCVAEEGVRSEWVVTSRHTPSRERFEERFDLVVICTGMYNEPNKLALPGLSGFKGRVLHTSEYKATAVPPKTVVLGFGKSAVDIAFSVASNSQEVSLVARNLHWPIPRHIAGVDAKWATMSRFAVSFLPSYQRQTWREKCLHERCCCLLGLPYRIAEVTCPLLYSHPAEGVLAFLTTIGTDALWV